MCSTDLVINERFTLSGDSATITDIETALAYITRHKWVESSDGRHVFTRHDAKNQQDLRYLVLNPADDRRAADQLVALRKEYDCFDIWLPLHMGRSAKLVAEHPARITPLAKADNQDLLGIWKVTYPQALGDFDRSLCNMNLPLVDVGEEYEGTNLMEVACRAALAFAGRFKDVYLYYNDRSSEWHSIALNHVQRQRLMKGNWEQFHRRFIWFPSLNPYAHIMDRGQLPPEVWKKKVELARQEESDRKKYDRENLRDFLENYRYKDKFPLSDKRLPRGILTEYLR